MLCSTRIPFTKFVEGSEWAIIEHILSTKIEWIDRYVHSSFFVLYASLLLSLLYISRLYVYVHIYVCICMHMYTYVLLCLFITYCLYVS